MCACARVLLGISMPSEQREKSLQAGTYSAHCQPLSSTIRAQRSTVHTHPVRHHPINYILVQAAYKMKILCNCAKQHCSNSCAYAGIFKNGPSACVESAGRSVRPNMRCEYVWENSTRWNMLLVALPLLVLLLLGPHAGVALPALLELDPHSFHRHHYC